jgi:SpoVK/Ycf46/Vps4 family AAA+-type ATPase
MQQKNFDSAKNYLANYKHKQVIIFIDEVDSFVKSGSEHVETYHSDAAAKLSQLLNDFRNMDRLYIFFATNNYRKTNNTFTSRAFGIHIPNPTKLMKEEIVRFYMNKHRIVEFSPSGINLIINLENSGIRDIEDIFRKAIRPLPKLALI